MHAITGMKSQCLEKNRSQCMTQFIFEKTEVKRTRFWIFINKVMNINISIDSLYLFQLDQIF